MINPLSPSIHIQILQTDFHTFSLRISSENVIKDHRIFPLVIILLILITLSPDNVWILLGENCFWSLLALKGLKKEKLNIPFNHEQPVKTVLATSNKILIIYRQTLNSKRFKKRHIQSGLMSSPVVQEKKIPLLGN